MCVCVITPEQMELDLAHTLPSRSTPTTPNPDEFYLPTKENLKASLDIVLQEADWFDDWVKDVLNDIVSEKDYEDCISREISYYFQHNFDLDDYDFDRKIDSRVEIAMEDMDVDYEIESKVDNWLSNNLDVDDAVSDAVSDAVTDYFSNVDVDEVAKQNITEILKDADFIEALAAEMLRQQQQVQAAPPAQTLGDSNESV